MTLHSAGIDTGKHAAEVPRMTAVLVCHMRKWFDEKAMLQSQYQWETAMVLPIKLCIWTLSKLRNLANEKKNSEDLEIHVHTVTYNVYTLYTRYQFLYIFRK